jgi:quercetin dioxygenase-like cupin family protein
MNNKEYVELVLQQKYPNDIVVPIDNPFIDERGMISNLWLGQSGSITLITSKKDSRRADHKHSKDWHTTYVISGSLKYIEEDNERTFNSGSLFFTKPGVFHTMIFLEDTIMITINNLVKNHENYENDVVR